MYLPSKVRSKISYPARQNIYNRMSNVMFLDISAAIHESYDGKGIGGSNPKTTYIAYGADTGKSLLDDDDVSFVN